MSSDSNGSSPVFDEYRNSKYIDIGKPESLWYEFRDLVVKENVDLSEAVKTVPSNVARTLQLQNKGSLQQNKDSDLVVFDDNFDIIHVTAKGKLLIENKRPVVLGTFEKAMQQVFKNL